MGQVCQKCGDGDLVCTKSKNAPGKMPSRNNKISQRIPGGAVSLPNSDMTFSASDKHGD